jgi:methylmalonyl-CoA mutase cobalamin-binding subunit
MRDNGIPEAQGQDGLDWFAGLAREALGRLVSIRDQQSVEVKQEHLSVLLDLLASDQSNDPAALLDAMLALHLDPEMVACGYVPAAAHALGASWANDAMSFVDVTIRTERLHALVRQVDDLLGQGAQQKGPSALILVAEAEQHTLGAFVLALQLRLAGFSATVRVAPLASDLTVLAGANTFDLALVSIGCSAALESGIGLVRTLRLMSRGEMCIFVGGAIPLTDEKLLEVTGADRVLRDVSAIMSEYDGCVAEHTLDRDGKRRQRNGVGSSVKGDGVDK